MKSVLHSAPGPEGVAIAGPVITLLTDFGPDDEYVGVVKGVILSINPAATIVDLCHHIPPGDVAGAAFMIEAASAYFPAGTLHLVIVDPGVGTERAIIGLKTESRIFIAPNNGVLERIIARNPVDSLVRIDNPDFTLSPVSRTFHGRDIFAPVGAHLSLGLDLRQVGSPMPMEKVLALPVRPAPPAGTGELAGTVVWIDRFGNLITDIDKERLDRLGQSFPEADLEISLGTQTLFGLSENYDSAGEKGALAIVGSRGYLEIAVCRGNAADRFEADRGDAVRVRVRSRTGTGSV